MSNNKKHESAVLLGNLIQRFSSFDDEVTPEQLRKVVEDARLELEHIADVVGGGSYLPKSLKDAFDVLGRTEYTLSSLIQHINRRVRQTANQSENQAGVPAE